tara:strand:- start:9243 stop:10526 length:1284 start_codon:yes stop_codon:yes gene_type:complete
MKKDVIYTESFLEELKDATPSFVEMYEDFQEGMVGFDFGKRTIEISSDFAENADPELLRLFLKTFAKPATPSDFSLPSKMSTQAMVHTHITGVDGSKSASHKVREEENKAQSMLNKLHMHLKETPIVEGEGKIPVNKLQALYLRAVMDELSKGFDNTNPVNNDPVEINKQGERVYSRKIEHEGKQVGFINYTESDSAVNILRSNVDGEMRNKGVGTKSYTDLIDEKIGQGKVINSDNIVSFQGRKLYKSLENKGYVIEENLTRKNHRDALTTLLPDNIREQQRSFPTVLSEGVRYTEPGYRLKGSPVFVIKESPNVEAKHKSATISLKDKDGGPEMTFKVEPNKISMSQRQDVSLESVSPKLAKQVENLLSSLEMMLTHDESDIVRQRLYKEIAAVWDKHSIERSDLELAILRKFENDNYLQMQHGS